MPFTQILKINIEITWRDKVEIVSNWATCFQQMLVNTVKMSNGIFILLSILLRQILKLFVPFDFYNKYEIPSFDKEIRAKLTAFWMLALFPCIINLVEPDWCGFNPR